MALKRYIFLFVGWLALFLGAIGIILPIVPTTPFLIVAGYCFSRVSPELHQWLLDLRVFGPMLRDWESHRVIRVRAKILATGAIVLLMSYPIIFAERAIWLRVVVVAIGVALVSFIWSCRSELPEEATRRFK